MTDNKYWFMTDSERSERSLWQFYDGVPAAAADHLLRAVRVTADYTCHGALRPALTRVTCHHADSPAGKRGQESD